jgi:hypothetical protein
VTGSVSPWRAEESATHTYTARGRPAHKRHMCKSHDIVRLDEADCVCVCVYVYVRVCMLTPFGCVCVPATVVGPNLYFDDATTTLLSAMESLRFSQQLVTFLGLLLTRRLRLHQQNRSSLQAVAGGA